MAYYRRYNDHPDAIWNDGSADRFDLPDKQWKLLPETCGMNKYEKTVTRGDLFNSPTVPMIFLFLAKVLCREIPIDQFIQHSVDIVRASVLVIQVVGVFPHVDGQ